LERSWSTTLLPLKEFGRKISSTSCLPCSLGEKGDDTTTGKDDASGAVFSVRIYRDTRQGNEGPHKEKTRD